VATLYAVNATPEQNRTVTAKRYPLKRDKTGIDQRLALPVFAISYESRTASEFFGCIR
jgi:hypothetical protein